jgi:ATP-dependent HslUV protease ATP-binding subunit HslU
MENIGARRLHAMMEHLLEDVSFNAGEKGGSNEIRIDGDFVRTKLQALSEDDDARKYLL